MCLLMTGQSAKLRTTLLNTNGLIASIFGRNSDGIGAMYTTSRNQLRTPKIIAKSVTEFASFIKTLPNDNRPIAIHARFKTHGDVNLDNCHPYPVIEGKIALMHNGILSQGNSADRTKSDTWHYINDVVRPQLEQFPSLFTLDSWVKMLENDITSGNRFAIMDNLGNLVVANKRTGIEHDGMWFSNTYAWDPAILIPGRARTQPRARPQSRDVYYLDDYGMDGWPKGSYVPSSRYSGKPLDVAGAPLTPASSKVEDDKILRFPIVPRAGEPSARTKVQGKSPDLAKEDGFSVVDSNGQPIKIEYGDDPTLAAVRYHFDEDDVARVLADADPDELEMMMIARTAFTLRTMLGWFFVPGNDPDLEMGYLDGAVVKLLVTKDHAELFRMATSTHSGLRVICEAATWFGEWHATQALADEAAAIVAEEAEADHLEAAHETSGDDSRNPDADDIRQAILSLGLDSVLSRHYSDMDDAELKDAFFPKGETIRLPGHSVSTQLGGGTPNVVQIGGQAISV